MASNALNVKPASPARNSFWRKLGLFFATLPLYLSAEPILIGTTQSPSPKSIYIENQLKAAYQQLGKQVIFIPMPSQRRLHLVSNLQLDADLFRICQLENDNLITVQAKLGDLYLQAFSLTTDILTNWQDNTELIVVHVRGLKMAELTSFVGNRLTVTSMEQAFGMLLQGRADVVLEDQLSAEAYLEQHKLHNISRVTLAPFAMCHVLGKDLEHLAAPLQQILLSRQP